MKISKSQTVAFTSYGSGLSPSLSLIPQSRASLSTRLDQIVEVLYRQNYTTFLSGMSEGFELLAAEAVLRAKSHYSDIRLIAVAPFPNQEQFYSLPDKKRYEILYSLADNVVVTSLNNSKETLLNHNDYLFLHASKIVCCCFGLSTLAMYACILARRKKVPVYNIIMKSDFNEDFTETKLCRNLSVCMENAQKFLSEHEALK